MVPTGAKIPPVCQASPGAAHSAPPRFTAPGFCRRGSLPPALPQQRVPQKGARTARAPRLPYTRARNMWSSSYAAPGIAPRPFCRRAGLCPPAAADRDARTGAIGMGFSHHARSPRIYFSCPRPPSRPAPPFPRTDTLPYMPAPSRPSPGTCRRCGGRRAAPYDRTRIRGLSRQLCMPSPPPPARGGSPRPFDGVWRYRPPRSLREPLLGRTACAGRMLPNQHSCALRPAPPAARAHPAAGRPGVHGAATALFYTLAPAAGLPLILPLCQRMS